MCFKRGRLKDVGVDQDENCIFPSTECQPNIFFKNYLNQNKEQFDLLNAKTIAPAKYNLFVT